MRKKYEKYELDAAYLDAITQVETLHPAIVGRDPFPQAASSIPFVKDRWDQLDGTSAGHHLFKSAFGDSFKDDYDNPRSAAFALMRQGVVLLNASYYFLEKDTVSQQKNFCFVQQSLTTNYPILERARHVLLCGDAAKMMGWVVEFTRGSFDAVPHPCPQGRNASTAAKRRQWDTWWSSGHLKTWIQAQAPADLVP